MNIFCTNVRPRPTSQSKAAKRDQFGGNFFYVVDVLTVHCT